MALPTYEELTKQGFQEGDIVPFEGQKLTIRPGGEVETLQDIKKSELGIMTSDRAESYKKDLDKRVDELSGTDTRFWMTKEEMAGGEAGKQAYNERVKQYYAPEKELKSEPLPTVDIPTLADDQKTGYQKLTDDLEQSRKEKDELIKKMSGYFISDEDLNRQTSQISSLYDTRIRDMQDINNRRVQSLATMGVRMGARYTGGMFGGVITEEERQGSQRVSELEAKKWEAIALAKSAARTNNWQIYSKQVDVAEEAYKEQKQAVKDFNQKIIDNNKALLETKKLQTDIIKTMSEISTKKAEAFAPYIADSLTGDVETDSSFLSSILESHPEMNQEILLGAISKAKFEREKAYLSEDIKNFQFAKTQGYKGTFAQWQIDEANRKAKAITPTGLTQPQINTFNRIVDKYNASPLIQASDRAITLKNSIKEVLTEPGNGAKQLNLIYGYIQALDQYQSAVREGEIALNQSLLGLRGKLDVWASNLQENKEILDEKTAKSIANAANSLIETIQQGAKLKEVAFKSQSEVAGVGKAWDEYIKGFTPSYQGNYSVDYQGKNYTFPNQESLDKFKQQLKI